MSLGTIPSGFVTSKKCCELIKYTHIILYNTFETAFYCVGTHMYTRTHMHLCSMCTRKHRHTRAMERPWKWEDTLECFSPPSALLGTGSAPASPLCSNSGLTTCELLWSLLSPPPRLLCPGSCIPGTQPRSSRLHSQHLCHWTLSLAQLGFSHPFLLLITFFAPQEE